MHSLNGEGKKKLLTRLARIEGQVGGLRRMIENDRYCVDVLTQVSAVRSALKKVGLKVLDGHVKGCVRTALETENDPDHDIIEELLTVIEKFTD